MSKIAMRFLVGFLLLAAAIWAAGFIALPRLETEVLARAKGQAEAGSYLEASEGLAQAAERLPNRAKLLEAAGRYALLGGDHPRAIAALEAAEAAQRGGLSPAGLLTLGDAYREAGEPEKALKAWETARQRDANPAEVFTRSYPVRRAQGDLPTALADLQALAALRPEEGELQYQLGLLLAALQPEAAPPHLERAGELDPALAAQAETLRSAIRSAGSEDPAYSLLTTGRSLAALDEWELAGAAFEGAVRARPDYAEAWAYLGEARQHGDPGEAVREKEGAALQALQQAAALDPRSLAARSFLALYWQRQGRYEQAVAELRAAVKIHPENPVLKVELGRSLALQGDLAGALETYQQAVALAPNSPAYLRYLAEFSLQHDYQVDELALPAARRALEMTPGDPAGLDLMGQVLIHQNDLAGGGRFLERALHADNDYAPAHLHLGLLYLLRGEGPRAKGAWQRVLALDSSSPAAAQAERLLETHFP